MPCSSTWLVARRSEEPEIYGPEFAVNDDQIKTHSLTIFKILKSRAFHITHVNPRIIGIVVPLNVSRAGGYIEEFDSAS
jgi:hypothetical protein